jgi:hypothetical protein
MSADAVMPHMTISHTTNALNEHTVQLILVASNLIAVILWKSSPLLVFAR